MKLTPRQLTAFLSLVDLQSFTQAADVLGVSQPTLSRIIQTVEEAVGAKLFDRDTRTIALTPIGLEVCPIARRLLHEYDNAALELARVVQGQHGRLTVAALPSVAGVLLPPS